MTAKEQAPPPEPPCNRFGKLVAKLRTARGLTQAELAEQTHVSVSTIVKTEASAQCALRRTTARHVFQALSAVAPLDPDSAAAYLEATGLNALLPIGQRYLDGAQAVAAACDQVIAGTRSNTIYGLILKALRLERGLERLHLASLACLGEDLVLASEMEGPLSLEISERLLRALHGWDPLSQDQVAIYLQVAGVTRLSRPLQTPAVAEVA